MHFFIYEFKPCMFFPNLGLFFIEQLVNNCRRCQLGLILRRWCVGGISSDKMSLFGKVLSSILLLTNIKFKEDDYSLTCWKYQTIEVVWL